MKILLPILSLFFAYVLSSCSTSLSEAGCQSTRPPKLSVFKFDGCSCFPEGTLKEPDLWEQHCLVHDYTYWQGGTRDARKQADLKLRDGIRSEGKPMVAQIAYIGVRIGGTPWLPTPWRWGFGWKEYPRGYREIGDEEKRQIDKFRPSWILDAKEPEREQGDAVQPATAVESRVAGKEKTDPESKGRSQ